MSEAFSLTLLQSEIMSLSIGEKKPPVILMSNTGFEMLRDRLQRSALTRRLNFSADGVNVVVELSDRLTFDGIPVVQVAWPENAKRQFLVIAPL